MDVYTILLPWVGVFRLLWCMQLGCFSEVAWNTCTVCVRFMGLVLMCWACGQSEKRE